MSAFPFRADMSELRLDFLKPVKERRKEMKKNCRIGDESTTIGTRQGYWKWCKVSVTSIPFQHTRSLYLLVDNSTDGFKGSLIWLSSFWLS